MAVNTSLDKFIIISSYNISAVSSTTSSLVFGVNEETKEVEFTSDYYALAHFSKFIHAGATVVESTDTGVDNEYELVNVVTANPNGTMTAVIVNNNAEESATCKMVMGDKVMEVDVAARSTVTVTWDANK